MNRTVKMLLAGAALVPGLSMANENLSYNYVEGGYVKADFDDTSNDADGFALRGSLAVADMWHLFSEFATLDLDGVSGDFDQMRVGGGVNYGLNQTVDLVGRASWVRYDFMGADEDGYGLQALLRSQVAPGFELEGGVDYIDLGGNADTTAFIAAGRYFFTPTMAVGLNVGIDDDANTYGLNFRLNFK